MKVASGSHLVVCSSDSARAPNSCVVTIVYTTEACGDRSTEVGRAQIDAADIMYRPVRRPPSANENFKSWRSFLGDTGSQHVSAVPAAARKVKRTGRKWAGEQVGRRADGGQQVN